MMEKRKLGFNHRFVLVAIWAPAVFCAALMLALPVLADEVFTLEHIAKMRTVGTASISPDGKLIAYTLHVPRIPFDEDDGGRWTELHVVDTEGNSRPFITGKVNIGGIDWTPDGKYISYLAKRGDDEHRSLYIIPIDGGESRRILEHETDISSYDWGPDGQRVAFLAKDKRNEEQEELRDEGFIQEIYEEELYSVRVWITEPFDTAAKPRKLDLPGSASTLHFCPEGKRLALALAPTPLIDDRYMRRKVHVVDIESGRIVIKFDNPGKLGRIAASPDCKYLAIISAIDIHDPRDGHLMIGDMASGVLTDLLPDFAGHIRDIAWRDNQTIRYLADEGVYTTLNEIRRDGTKQKTIIEAGGPALWGLSVADDGKSAAFDGSSPTFPWEVCYFKPGAKQVTRLTESNPWLKNIRLAPQEVVEYNARDGLGLQGILIHPIDEKGGARYPLILSVHGGP